MSKGQSIASTYLFAFWCFTFPPRNRRILVNTEFDNSRARNVLICLFFFKNCDNTRKKKNKNKNNPTSQFNNSNKNKIYNKLSNHFDPFSSRRSPDYSFITSPHISLPKASPFHYRIIEPGRNSLDAYQIRFHLGSLLCMRLPYENHFH